MTKEEFIKQRMEIDKVTRTYFDKNYIVIECTCGKEYCNGWRCLPKSYVVDYIKQLQQENKELYKEILDKTTTNITLKKDRDYWQNIVNKSEQWLEEKKNNVNKTLKDTELDDDKRGYMLNVKTILKECLDKLKVLKGINNDSNK